MKTLHIYKPMLLLAILFTASAAFGQYDKTRPNVGVCDDPTAGANSAGTIIKSFDDPSFAAIIEDDLATPIDDVTERPNGNGFDKESAIISPGPVTDMVKLNQIGIPNSGLRLSVYNSSGQEILVRYNLTDVASLNMHLWPADSYLILVTKENNIIWQEQLNNIAR